MIRKVLWRGALTGAFILPGAVLAGDLPANPTVVAGTVTFSAPTADTMVVGQSSQYGIINWNSFSIGQGYGVEINNGSGATLNRVTGTEASSLLGSLSATGSVYLVNPNGIVIGDSGVVNTGGRFVASTLDLSNSDFLDGGDLTFSGNSTASVVNLGKVSSLGGDVALIAQTVDNQGSISAPQGTVGLVAGTTVVMRDASVDDGMFSVTVGSADNSVTTSGAISAAAAELRANGGNVYALAGNTQNTIAATGVAHVNGRVFLTAGAKGKVSVEGSVTAKNADGSGGSITATGGTVDVSGKLDASGTTGGTVILNGVDEATLTGQILATGGAGGFAEVSGAHVTLTGDVNTGGGNLLIDPVNVEITNGNGGDLSNASLISASGLASLLATQDVTITSAGSGTYAGTILVQDTVAWGSSHSLTLMAQGDLLITGSIINYSTTGGGDINLVAGWDGSTAFNASTFNAANLTSTSIFGNANGVSYAYNYVDGNGNSGTASLNASGLVDVFASGYYGYGVSVGSRSGATRVYANGLTLQSPYNGSSSYDTYAQLGYNISSDYSYGMGYYSSGSSLPAITGDITVHTKSFVHLLAGSGSNAYAQIGHVGIFNADAAPSSVDVTGSITVETGGDVWLIGGDGTTASSSTPADNGQYAMIGNGSLADLSSSGVPGNRSGAITVTAGGKIYLETNSDSSLPTNGVFIGDTTAGGTVSGADITLNAGTFSYCTTNTCIDDAIDIGMLGQGTQGGDVRVTSTSGHDLTLTGSTASLSNSTVLYSIGVTPVASPAALAIGSPLNSSGALIVQTAAGGNIILAPSFDYANTNPASTLVLASGSNILNNAGANAISGFSGGYAFYSNGPQWDTGLLGVITPQALNFGVTYDPANPLAGTANSNSIFVYRWTPNSPTLVSTTLPPVDTRGLGNFPTTPLGFDPAGSTSLQTINTETTQKILDQIANGVAFCHKAVGSQFRVDCLSERLQSVADSISSTGEYSDVRSALQSAAQKLHALAAQNASSVLGKNIAPVDGVTLSRPLLPVSAAAMNSVNAKAADIIAGTQLVLLRSSTNSDRRRAAYQQVSAVLNTSLVLLRS